MKALKLMLCGIIGLLAIGTIADDTGKVLELKFTMRDGRGDPPLAVLWLENDEGDFVKTLYVFSKSKKYYKDLLAWSFKSRKAGPVDFDGISGATMKWKSTRTVTVPVQLEDHNLLDGSYILRLESRKDKGGHYRTFQIPLTKDFTGGTFEHDGYIQQVEIVIRENAKQEP